MNNDFPVMPKESLIWLIREGGKERCKCGQKLSPIRIVNDFQAFLASGGIDARLFLASEGITPQNLAGALEVLIQAARCLASIEQDCWKCHHPPI